MLKINIEINGKEQEFVQNKRLYKAIRKIAEMRDKVQEAEKGKIEMSNVEAVDEMYMIVVEIFNNQFTFDELISGSDYEEVVKIVETFETMGKKKTPAKRQTKQPSK
ncbi:phage tail assembly chaperone G [Mammaliicoccus sciuri]|uniref:phage tail assembly chaperone G n=1 Tax=Mammaliicoccus sciuri TaxID=1296 RepID=UPI00265C11D0|nr:hypothetical protein [Mammaliicoccus sciuri]MDO0948229.1 hypothetical protein [Mammaliicoccus sciuri]MDO0953401.1 hypothetical protein [Mammaliicoccus sciuri]